MKAADRRLADPTWELRRPARLTDFLIALGAILCLAGCAVGPKLQRPALETAAGFRFATGGSTNSFADLPWWQVFKDPHLLGLISTAVTNNLDLRQAMARVEHARNLAAAARGSAFPQVSYDGALGRGRNAAFNSPVPANGATESSAASSLHAFWEIDLWGRIGRLSEAARARSIATEETRRSITTALVSDVATAYFELLQLDEELAIQRAATNAYAVSLRLFEDRLLNGAASKLETDRAAAALANATAHIPQLELSLATTENRLNVLLGQHPAAIERPRPLDPSLITPEIPPGLPTQLLLRRPDLRAQEQLLVAANADIGASLAEFFPRFGMTTLIGKVSPELSAFTLGSANVWNVGASLAGPVFQGGRLRSQYRASKAAFDEAKAAYEQSLLRALQEVSDALITREKLGDARRHIHQAAAALSAAVELARQRYLGGRSNYYEVLQAQQELYPTLRAEVQARVGELTATIRLYKALGGGWQASAPQPAD